MAPLDPATARQIDDIRKNTATVEERIARLLGVQNSLIEEQNNGARARAAHYSRTAAEIDEILRKTNSYTSSSRGATTSTNDYGAATRRAGDATSQTTSALGGMSAAIDKVLKGSSLLSSQVHAYRENLDNLAAPHVNIATLMKNLAGGSLAVYRAMDKSGKGLDRYYKQLGDTSKIDENNQAQIRLLERVNSTNAVFSKAGTIIPDLMQKMTGLDVNKTFLPEFNAQGQSFVEVMGGELNVLEGFANVFNDVQLSAAFSKDQLSKSADEISKSIARTGFAIKAYDITNGDVTEMIRRNYVLTGKATTDYFDQVVEASEKSSLAFGMSAEQIVKDTLDMMNNVQMFGFRTPEEFARISKAAQDSHVSISELAGIMGKFDTFETASSAVGDLNATLGTNFDAVELMTLKYTDPVKMLQRLGEGFRETGQTFDDMFMAPEKLPFLTATLNGLGVTAEQLRAMFEGTASATDIIKQQADASKEVKDSEIDIDELMKSRITLMQGVAKDTDDMVRRLDQAAQFMAGSSRSTVQAANDVNTQFLQLSNTIVKEFAVKQKEMITEAADAYKEIVEGVLKVFNENLKGTTEIIADAQKAFDVYLAQVKAQAAQASTIPAPAAVPSPVPAPDVALSPGSPTRVSREFGGLFEDYILDSRDALLAGPPKMLDGILKQAKAMKQFIEAASEVAVAEPTEAPRITRPTSTPSTLPTQLQARLQPIGSTLNISIDSATFIQYIMETMAKEYPV